VLYAQKIQEIAAPLTQAQFAADRLLAIGGKADMPFRLPP